MLFDFVPKSEVPCAGCPEMLNIWDVAAEFVLCPGCRAKWEAEIDARNYPAEGG